jgi:hypothetical protein
VVVLDAALSPADAAEPEWAPTELCTTPERGSTLDPAVIPVDVELVSAPPELCTIPDRGSVVVDVDPAADVENPSRTNPSM